MHSRVTRARSDSSVAKDEVIADVGMPFAIPTSRWKAGYVYASITEVIRRIGSERWSGSFRAARQAGVQQASAPFELLSLD